MPWFCRQLAIHWSRGHQLRTLNRQVPATGRCFCDDWRRRCSNDRPNKTSKIYSYIGIFTRSFYTVKLIKPLQCKNFEHKSFLTLPCKQWHTRTQRYTQQLANSGQVLNWLLTSLASSFTRLNELIEPTCTELFPRMTRIPEPFTSLPSVTIQPAALPLPAPKTALTSASPIGNSSWKFRSRKSEHDLQMGETN